MSKDGGDNPHYNCTECGNTDSAKFIHDPDNGETVCMECGYVIQVESLDPAKDWRAFDDEQEKKRAHTGTPPTFTLHDKGLTTIIDWRDADAYGKEIDVKERSQLYRMRKWQRRARISDTIERSLAFARGDIEKLIGNLSLSRNVFETASVIYRKAAKERLVRGRSYQSIGAACVYIAARQCGHARPLEEVSTASNVSRKDLGRDFRFLYKELGLSLESVPHENPKNYTREFCEQLTLGTITEAIANKILKATEQTRLKAGRGPTSLVAAAIYIATVLTGERKTQKEVADTANVTEVTVRNRYKELTRNLLFLYSL